MAGRNGPTGTDASGTVPVADLYPALPEPDSYPWRVVTEAWEEPTIGLLHRSGDVNDLGLYVPPEAADPLLRERIGLETARDLVLSRALMVLRHLYERLDKLDRLFVSQSRKGQPVCVEQCGLCCLRGTPVITEVEGEMISSWLQTRPAAQQRAVEQDLLSWATTEMSAGPEAKPSRLAPDERYLSPAQRQVAASPCAFLDRQTLRCRIAPVKPLRCQAYSVTEPPDHYCRRPLMAYETDHRRAALDPESSPELRKWAQMFQKWWRAAAVQGLTVRHFAPWQVLRLWRPEQAQATLAQDRSATAAAKRERYSPQRRPVIVVATGARA